MGYFPRASTGPPWVVMESHSPAEELPALYRAILDRVAELERVGDRDEARQVRQRATVAYSRAWDERARRQLLGMLRDAERPTDVERFLLRSGRRLLPGATRGPIGQVPIPDR